MRISYWSSDVCSSDLPGHSVDDRIGQALGTAVTDRRNTVLRSLDDRQAPPFLPRRHEVNPRLRKEFMFTSLVDVTVERDGVTDSQLGGAISQVLLPPTTTDDVEMDVRKRRTQGCDGLRSEEMRVGEAWGSTCRSRGAQ